MAQQKQAAAFEEVDLEAVAAEGRDLEDEIALAIGRAWDTERQPLPEDGDLPIEEVVGRSMGPAWDRAFRYAKAKGNSNKAAAIFADSNFAAFEPEGLYAKEYRELFEGGA